MARASVVDYASRFAKKTKSYASDVTGFRGKTDAGSKIAHVASGNVVTDTAANLAVDGAILAAKGANKAVPFTTKTEANIGNLWTGRREGPGAIAVGAVIGAGYMGYNTMAKTELAPKTGQTSYTGTMPIMDADGVGSTTNAPTLGASGSMVFGMHNSRRG